MTPEIKTGTYAGTGSLVTVTLGFTPKYLRILNITDGTETIDFIDTMTAATDIKTDTAVAGVTTNGITLTTGGFTVGTDGAANTSGKTYHYFAIGSN